jgi:hypothetical protein
MTRPALIIMAAGIGSRYGGLKQVEAVGPDGELVIEYSIYDALRAGFNHVIFLIREDMLQLFREKVGMRVEGQVPVTYAFQRLTDLPAEFSVPPERVKPWGTAHAVWSCRNVISQPFAAINADDFYGRAAFAAMGAYLTGLPDSPQVLKGCMAGYQLENTLSEHGSVARGICQVSAQGHLESVREHLRIQRMDGLVQTSPDGLAWSPLPADSTVSMNMWGFTPAIFGEIGERFPGFLHRGPDQRTSEFYLPNVVGEMIADQRMEVQVLPVPARWFGVTYPADLPLVRERMAALVQAGEYPARLWGAAAAIPAGSHTG